MEDMARLAFIEQNIGDAKKYEEFLYTVLRVIGEILKNPHDFTPRIIDKDGLPNETKIEAVVDYLKYLGFQEFEGKYKYPKENALDNLRIAEAVIERKINLCFGHVNPTYIMRKNLKNDDSHTKKIHLTPVHLLDTQNSFLLKIESLFNNVLLYEDEDLQKYARRHIPISVLQIQAMERVRDHQKRIKTGETEGQDLTFDIALLVELLGWFKYSFFSWVDSPPCERCGGQTSFVKTKNAAMENETCRVEVFQCATCSIHISFPRYNDPRTLLRTRRGRCGEWANCFTLLLRALGYDARYVYDNLDHVWCEVFDYDLNTWLHLDPCENKLDTPLMYCHGWGKKLSYVIAVSRDDLQDVTWRYTMNHKEVLARRDLCTESELINCILTLRQNRQRQVSEARQRYLTKRCLQELVQLMVERKPTDYESHGRMSGSRRWRQGRGELGCVGGYTFTFNEPGDYNVRYYTAVDKYVVTKQGAKQSELSKWSAGVYTCENVFRKHESDWNQVYLAREEGEDKGSISWRISTSNENIRFTSLSVSLSSTLYENGNIEWNVKFDEEDAIPINSAVSPVQYERDFRAAVLSAVLSGGVGEVAWQHAQLFRQSTEEYISALDIELQADNVLD